METQVVDNRGLTPPHPTEKTHIMISTPALLAAWRVRDFVGLCDAGPMVNRRRKTKSSETHRDRQRLAPGVVPVRPIARLLLAAWATRPWHRAGRETPASRSTPERPAIGSLLFARFLNVKRFVVERW